MQFKDGHTIKSLSKKIPKSHIEVARNPLASYEYCQKEDTRLEGPTVWGDPPKPRKNVKGDTKQFNLMVFNEGPERMVEDGRLSIMQYKKLKENLNSYKLHTAIHPTLGSLNNEWVYGPSGTGKSRYVRETYGDSLFDKPCNKWWDGYQNEDTILLDDFGQEHSVLGHHLKRWADHYPFKIEIKGTVTQARPARIVVTSNYHPNQIWKDRETLEPILRRFTLKYMDRLQNFGPPPILNFKI